MAVGWWGGAVMAVCEWCHQEMFEATTCVANLPLEMDGAVYQPVSAAEDCGDCGVSRGGLHHPGCDIELCPRCGGQRIACACATRRAPSARPGWNTWGLTTAGRTMN